ncbi:MAG: tRNA uridine-5-carboxymethylaminomethyl(34) synthesis GTPase MnmE [Cyanobacteria bacterium]|nr:tRNA uridine-5-carboxymethylaminomethyl(34) synthesis GTPase MnmE [Cyanobacteriota bacterium]
MNSTEEGSENSTIAAIATAQGASGVAVIRISGPHSWAIARSLFQGKAKMWEHGRFYHGWIVDQDPSEEGIQGRDSTLLDEVLLLCFQGPKSFTGEDVIEIHCHGGDFLSRKILSLCFEQGALPAGAGEFTKRAFLNGKMDLTQAESVMDLISAQGETLLRVATGNLKSRGLGQSIDAMAQRLMQVQAEIVASVDFPDEVDEPSRDPLIQELLAMVQQVNGYIAASENSHFIREGLKLAILGLPNAGKSSLFNALLLSDRAIVTEIPGTTRDLITEKFMIAGVPVTLVDTAGIRETNRPDQAIEKIGIERTWQAAQEADAILYVYDVTQGLQSLDESILQKLHSSSGYFSEPCKSSASSSVPPVPVLILANKLDQLETSAILPSLGEGIRGISVKTGEGLPEVFQWLESVINGLTAQAKTADSQLMALSLNQRQQGCLRAFCSHIHETLDVLQGKHLPIDVATVPLTDALKKLDELTGRDTNEEVLTQVFSQFCVGK